MSHFRFGVAIFLSCMLVASASIAEMYEAGRDFSGFQAVDQNDVAFAFKPGDTRIILFDTPGDSAPAEQPQDPAWLTKRRAVLIVNMSDFSFVKRHIALTRLEAKPFRVLVVDDKDVAARFRTVEGKLTAILLDEKGTITEIRFISPGEELLAFLDGAH